MVAVAGPNGRIAVVDAADKLVWKRRVADWIETNIGWVADEVLVAGTTGTLLAMRTRRPGE